MEVDDGKCISSLPFLLFRSVQMVLRCFIYPIGFSSCAIPGCCVDICLERLCRRKDIFVVTMFI